MPTRPFATRDSIASDLRSLGVEPGGTLLVHSSMRALGWVCGGPVAVVQALLDVLGPGGTLAVPTFTADNRDPSRWTSPAVPEEWWPVIRAELPAFEPSITPSQQMGAISEQVRTWPGALRSGHPQVSFTAVGPRAAELVSGHELTCHLGERSPLARLEERDALVLLLGVGWERCTAFHLAEYRQAAPLPVRDYECVVSGPGGRRWVTYEDVDLDQSDFAALGEDFERADRAGDGQVAAGDVGPARCRTFPLRAAVGFATAWIPAHRLRRPPSDGESLPSHDVSGAWTA